ncbi:hypothetical protein ACFL4D_01740 [Candidatus Margulisiibacteriota bacterium]
MSKNISKSLLLLIIPLLILVGCGKVAQETGVGGQAKDIYEPDNNSSQATTLNISSGSQVQERNFHNDTDIDYCVFYADANELYIFYTTGGTDTEGVIRNSSQSTVTSNNNSGEDSNFRLEWTAPSSGYYYLIISRYINNLKTVPLVGSEDEIGTIRPYTLYFYKQQDMQAPTAISASDGSYSDRIELSWNSVSGASRYYVYRATSSSGTYTQIGSSTSTQYTDNSITPGTYYYYKVKSYRAGMYSDYSSYNSGYVILQPPSNVTASDGAYAGNVRVSWDSVSGATSYYVYRAFSSGGSYSQIGNTSDTHYFDSNITGEDVYYYKVKAYRSGYGYSNYSSYDSGYGNISAPTNVTATDGAYDYKVKVNWSGVSNASRYYVYRATSAFGTYSVIGNTTDESYDDTSGTPGTMYYYKVKAYNSSSGYTEYSYYNSGYRELEEPANVSASDGTYSDKVRVSWSSVTGATNYYVYRASSATGTYSLRGSSTSTSYDDTSASSGTYYYYKVKAYSSSSHSYSDYSSYNRGNANVSVPNNVDASDGTYTDKVYVTWDSVAGATYYYVYRAGSSAGSYSSLGNTSSTEYNDTSAYPGTEYFYKIKSWTSSGGYSEYSSDDSGYRQLSTPSSISATDAEYTGKVRITWSGVTGADRYYVYRGNNPDGTYSEIGNSSSTTYDDETASYGQIYYYKVKAYSDDSSSYSEYSIQNSGIRKLEIPSNVVAQDGASDDYGNVNWSSVTGASRYYVYRATSYSGTYSQLGYTSGISYNDTGAVNGTLYYYKVRAYSTSSATYSDYSPVDQGYRRLHTPSSVAASDGNFSSYVNVSWSGVTGATKYYIYRAFTSGGTYNNIGNTTGNSYQDTQASIGAMYFYRIRAYTDSSSSYSFFSSYDSGYRTAP